MENNIVIDISTLPEKKTSRRLKIADNLSFDFLSYIIQECFLVDGDYLYEFKIKKLKLVSPFDDRLANENNDELALSEEFILEEFLDKKGEIIELALLDEEYKKLLSFELKVIEIESVEESISLPLVLAGEGNFLKNAEEGDDNQAVFELDKMSKKMISAVESYFS